jgi:ADP-ribosyl-[dinitrogen reductase] hydrolase
MAELVRASTRITHTDPRAEQGAMIVATAARLIVSAPADVRDVDMLSDRLMPLAVEPELQTNMQAVFDARRAGLSVDQFAAKLGLSNGVSGYVNHTVPIAIYCWMAHRSSFRDAVESAVCLGGDSDTVGAIVGALAGCELGPGGIPKEWLDGVTEWPCTLDWIKALSRAVADSTDDARPVSPIECSALSLLTRNLFFAAVILTIGFRRLLPPYG